MPLYICNAAKGAIAPEAKANIAKDITDIHCDVTGAPPAFVHVFFFDGEPFPLVGDAAVQLRGSIRAGRTTEQKATMREQMTQSVTTHAGVAADSVATELVDVPASWVMEGGDLLPEPGEEDDWLKAHEAKLATGAAE